MKKLMTVAMDLMLVVGLSGFALAGSLDSPGAPSAGSGMYTLQNLYDYLTSGAALTVQNSFQEPTSGPGSTMKTTRQIGDEIKSLFDQCISTTAADVRSGMPFFCTQSGSWGIQTGTLVVPPTPTPTITPYGIYASCKAIKTATPTASDGLYTIDPDGPGGSAPLDAYCDMTSDGGGWTLAARIVENNDHLNAGAVGTLTSPTQSTCSKLSDGNINTLATELIRLTCESPSVYFDPKQRTWTANTPGSAAIDKYKLTYGGTSWTAGSPYSTHCGVTANPTNVGTYGSTTTTGCLKSVAQWGGTGTLYVK